MAEIVLAQTKLPAEVPSKLTLKEREKELLKPFTAEELKVLINDLQPVRLKQGGGWTTRAAMDNKRVDYKRAAIVLNDATAMLALIQRDELMKNIAGPRGAGAGDLAFLENAYKGISLCLEIRFKEFGGPLVLDQMTNIVEGMRAELEIFFSDRILSEVCNTPECRP